MAAPVKSFVSNGRHAVVAYGNQGAMMQWEGKMKSTLKITSAVICGLLFGGGAVQLLHAQSKPPAFVVTEIAVKDEEGYAQNFLKAAQKDIADHGGKYLAGGYKKTLSLAGSEPPNRVVVLQFANMDAVKEWRDQGAMDLENSVGSKYATFRIYAIEGVTQ
ncbi:MAG TPA: DUF1330 domain-containing protein [Xanthobacteraceae bacterium]|jgi:uncharacterized protein (DUF1330 family)